MGWSRIAGLVLLLGASSCASKIAAYDARFTVAYDATVEIENFTKPIAPGAKLPIAGASPLHPGLPPSLRSPPKGACRPLGSPAGSLHAA